MTRYQILDELLSSRYHNYSLDDLTEEVNIRLAEIDPKTSGVGRRTIEKDIKYLEFEGPFLVEIERYSIRCFDPQNNRTFSKRCLRYAQHSFSIFKKQLSSDEKYLLREVLSLLGQFEGLPNLDGLEKLRLGLGFNTDYKHIISFTRNPLEGSSLFGELFTAIAQKQVINLQYHTFVHPDITHSINLYPYLLKEYNRRWYLLGASEEDGKLLNFSLDRIDKFTPLTSHIYRDYDGDINERFEDIIGVTFNEESPIYKIIFWASDSSKDYVCTKPIHESQRKISEIQTENLRNRFPFLKGGKFFRIDCKENYELIRELTSFGEDLIVLEPRHILDKIIDSVKRLHEVYKKIRT